VSLAAEGGTVDIVSATSQGVEVAIHGSLGLIPYNTVDT